MKILIAIDGSPQSFYSIQALAHFGPVDELALVHALHFPDLNHPMIPPDIRENAMQEMENTLRPKGEALLEQCLSGLPTRVGKVKRIHQIGFPAMVILDTAKSVKPDLIMMGARGLGPIKELVLGSVSHRVLLHAPCSTLTVKNPFPALQHLLMPIEGKEDAECLLHYLFSLPFVTKPRISVMSVWPQPQLPWPETLSQSKLLEEHALAHARDMAEEVAQQAEAKHFSSQAIVGLGDPAFAILEQAKIIKPDLIMVGSHGRHGLSGFLLGSVSHSLVHQATAPVLVVRSSGS
ncbi:MAG: universal stress protein [Nitrospira sp. SB0666_bin_27]|nr:universal stress protein [Nitrospira sp. SB0666_bin_27]MYF24152.1 universal stress protein [Nitrospira sp. SB0678_bin_10]